MCVWALRGLAGDALQVVRCKAVQMRSFELHVDVSKLCIESQEKLRGLHVQGGDDAFDIGQRHIALATLHTTHVAAIQAAVMRKTLLRKSLCFAVLAYGIPESLEQGGAVCIGHWFACHGAQWLRFVAVLTTVHLHT